MEAPPPEDVRSDLGFGGRVAQRSRERFLNRDGSFNVERDGLLFYRALNPYHALLTMSWPSFYALILLLYVVVNVIFAGAYLLCGPDALLGAPGTTPLGRGADAFFFSVQTLATIGYGRISPNGLAANILVAVEALMGMLGFTLAAGLSFARFSRPNAKILFSERAIIAPYRGIRAFEFRIANERTSQLIEVHATVVLSRLETIAGQAVRRFHALSLERDSVVFFPLHWVVVHPIDDQSPLQGATQASLEASGAEFLILLTGVDETFSQTVHTRSSYKAHEVVVGARFVDMFQDSENGRVRVDMRRLNQIEPADLP